MIDADHIVQGDGISWMRRYLGEDPEAPIRHPRIVSGFGFRMMGHTMHEKPASAAATIIPSVGCPMGCNFCTTSSFFGGKGKFINFYETGRELFDMMARMERTMGAQLFFMMDENFLLHRQRAMELLALMKEHNKSWAFYVFSSANAIRKYTHARTGASWGFRGSGWGWNRRTRHYAKLEGTDTRELTRELREHGIKLLGSTIVGLEHHTPENIREEIEHAVAHDTDFHQFMLYTPVPGTPLYQEMAEQGRLLDDVDLADIHGQFKFNFRHAAISRDDSKRFLDWAFYRDFELNGPSLYRICQTMLQGWRHYRENPDRRIRARYAREAGQLRNSHTAALWVMEQQLRNTNPQVSRRIRGLRLEIEHEFGWRTKLVSKVLGPVLLWMTRREERRLSQGTVYEPPVFVERMHWANAERSPS